MPALSLVAMVATSPHPSSGILAQELNKTANTLSDSKALQRASLPVDKATVTRADAARIVGRRLILGNKGEAKLKLSDPES